MDGVHGTVPGEYMRIWPQSLGGATYNNNTLGVPEFPVDYDKTSFYILDQSPGYYLRFLQGVNIYDGSIYSNRPTIVGGALVSSGGYNITTDHVNNGLDAYLWGYAMASYTTTMLRYDMNIVETDIVLAEAAAPVTSWIQRPDTWQQQTYEVNAATMECYPAMRISGGTIYVGKNHNLRIEGTALCQQVRRDSSGNGMARVSTANTNRNGTDVYGRNYNVTVGQSLNNMFIAPEKIVVNEGATLTIEPSTATNIFTDIYVDGGELVIYEGARMQGNIYCYNAGKVTVARWTGSNSLTPVSASDAGKITLNGRAFYIEQAGGGLVQDSSGDPRLFPGGIFIYGSDARLPDGTTAVAAGSFDTDFDSSLMILGNDGVDTGSTSISYGAVHLVGASVDDGYLQDDVAGFICNHHNAATGNCLHFTGGTNTSTSWYLGTYTSN
jgi:hypothetical protein